MWTRSNGNSTPGGGAKGFGSVEPELAEPVLDPSHPRRNLACELDDEQTKAPQQRRGPDRSPRTPPRSEPAPSRTATSCARRTSARLPRPSRLTRPVADAEGRRAAAGRPRRPRSGSRRSGDLLWHVPHGHRDRAEAATARRAADRRAGDGEGRACARRACGPTRRRGLRIVEAARRRRQRAGEGGLVQPGVARRAPAARAPGCCSTASSTARAFASPSPRGARGARRARPGIHTTGIVPVHPRHRAAAREAASRVGLAGDRPLAADAIEPLPAELRARRGLRRRGRRAAPPPTSRTASTRRRRPRDRLAFEELFLHQVALAARRRRARATSPGRSRSGRRASWSSGWLASLPFELTGDQRGGDRRDRRRPRRSGGRCSAC